MPADSLQVGVFVLQVLVPLQVAGATSLQVRTLQVVLVLEYKKLTFVVRLFILSHYNCVVQVPSNRSTYNPRSTNYTNNKVTKS